MQNVECRKCFAISDMRYAMKETILVVGDQANIVELPRL